MAAALPEVNFILVGACSLPAGWCTLDNVHMLGQRAYDDVPAYMRSCDVLMMPWNRSRWIEGCNPIKLKEYLAAGRPIVSTPFPELTRYDHLVHTAEDADAFTAAIRRALAATHDAAPGRQRVARDSWSAKAAQVASALRTVHVHPTTPDLLPTIEALPTEPEIAVTAHAPAPRRRPPVTSTVPPLNLKECIILSGGLNPSPLISASGRSILDLWLTPENTVVDLWVERLRALGGLADALPQIHIVHDENIPVPWSTAKHNGSMRVTREPTAYRGPAGVVSDCCANRGADEHMLIAEAARFVSCDLQGLVQAHLAHRADITIAVNDDDSPAGIYLARCATLGLIPERGFMDLKEQWLQRALDAGLRTHVHRLEGHGAMPLRTQQQFIHAAQIANDGDGTYGVIPVDGEDALRVICPGALVGPGATIVDSIVMPEAVVGANAVVVRSIVFPDGTVEAGSEIADALVAPDETQDLLKQSA